MKDKRAQLGPLGAKFIAYAQINHLEIVKLGELQKPLALSASQERKLLERLNRDGFVFRLQRGVYIVPNKLSPGGYWRPNDYLIVAKFMQLQQAHYYIGGPTAFNRHGFSNQIPNQLMVYNDKISGLKKFGSLSVKCIKVSRTRIIGFERIKIPLHKETVNIANRVKTIIDAVNDWNRYQTLPAAYNWLKQYYADQSFLHELIKITVKSANNNAIRRIGYYLESLGVDSENLQPLLKKLNSIQSWVPLVPQTRCQGKTNKKWRIIDNAE